MSAQCRKCMLKFPVRAVRQHETQCSPMGVVFLKPHEEELGMVMLLLIDTGDVCSITVDVLHLPSKMEITERGAGV